MSDDLSFDDFSPPGMPKPEKRVESRAFDFEPMLDEVAIHEASHFVFNVLVLRLKLGFTDLYGVKIKVDDEFAGGETEGCLPPVDAGDPEGRNQWFIENPKRIWARFFSTMVGYVTYKSFLNDDDYFIGRRTGLIQDKERVYYYNLKSALKENPYVPKKHSRIHDFFLINKYFQLLGIEDFSRKQEVCEVVIKELMKLLAKESIRRSIEYVKNILKSNNNRKIEQEELEEMHDQVNELTKNVSLADLVKEYELKFDT